MGIKLKINRLIKLVSEVTDGQDNFKEGAIGFNGYGFIFRSFDYKSKDSFVIGDGSSKLCSISAFKDIYKKSIEHKVPLKSPIDFLNYDQESDLCFGGALKTLVPDIKFGGVECLYDVWMFVKTPLGRMFPATLYYGVSKTTIGAWSPDFSAFLFADSREFPKEFRNVINFSPFDFSEVEREKFIEALEFSLAKVSISDFEGIYRHDFGYDLMGIRSGQPFITPLSKEEYRKLRKVKTWSYSIMGNNKASSFYNDFIEIKYNFITNEESKKYPKEIPMSLHATLIERCYEQLVLHAYNKKSRLAFMVLGCFLMAHKGKITEDLKRVILKYSDWGCKKDQLKNRQDRKERKKFLLDFREKIKNYDGTKEVKLLYQQKNNGDIQPIWHQNIDYSIDN